MRDAVHLETSRALDAVSRDKSNETNFPVLTAEQERRLAWMLNTYFDSVWRAGRRMGLQSAQAQENAQEAFSVAARKLDCIEPGRERTFLLGVALRLAANARRRMSARIDELATDSVELEALDAIPLADELLAQRQQRSLLDRILMSMSDLLREVLTLYEIEELNLSEIAEVLEIPEGTAASRLRRAREEFSRKFGRFATRVARAKESP
jgi:RNA polymerase sigma-70 factor (ECF subfamily)